VIIAHVEENVRMIKWRLGTDTLEFMDPDADLTMTCRVMEVQCFWSCHGRINPSSVIRCFRGAP